ncbi:putative multidrug export ATP-binding/permease protein [compost metagenome]
MNKIEKIQWVYRNVNGIKKYLAMIIGLSILVSFFEIVSPMAISIIIDKGIIGKNLKLLFTILVLYFTIVFCNYLFSWIIRRVEISLGNRVFETYSKKIFDNLFQKEGEYYTNYSVGDLLTVFFQDVFSIKSFFTQSVSMFFLNILVFLFVLIKVFFINVPIGCVITINSVLVLIYQLKTQKRSESLFVKSKQSYIKYNDSLQNVLSNLMNVLSLGMNKKLKKTNSRLLHNVVDNEKKIAQLYASNTLILLIISNFPIVIIYGYGGYLVSRGDLTIGVITSLIMYYQNLFSPLMKAINTRNLLQEGFLSIERVRNFLINSNREILEKDGKLPFFQNGNTITLNNISFGYGDRKVIDDISLTFNKGDINFIVGKSGSGKSSLLKLIYRLWEPDFGTIKINNIDIRDSEIENYRDNISFITQNIHMFNDTIKNNILLGNEIGEESLLEILKLVELEGVVDALPDGINTTIGVEGNNLSGGQLQRIAIARELISNKQILLLDEFTNSLDKILEDRIIKNIIQYCKNKTIIIVTHHMDTTLLGDKIFVLSDGKITESDSPNNLLKLNGEFVELMMDAKSTS